MDQEVLVRDDIEFGRQAVEAFDEFGPPARCVFWLYFPDAEEWRLLVATPVFDKEGPLAAIKAINKSLKKKDLAGKIHPLNIAAVSTRDRRVRALRAALRSNKPGPSGVRFQGIANEFYIQGSFVYRMN